MSDLHDSDWLYFLKKTEGYDLKVAAPIPKEIGELWVNEGYARLATEHEIKVVEEARAEQKKLKEFMQEIKILLLSNKKNKARHRTGEYIKDRLNVVAMNDTEELLHYNQGIYHVGGEVKLKERIQEMWGDLATTYDVSETVGHIRRSTYISRKEFNMNPNEVCLRNGILNMEIKELGEFSPERMFFYKIPVKYNPDAECPEIEKFLGEILYEVDIPTIYELLGYCLLPKYLYQKAFLFTGEGANGKSTLINLFKAFLGCENITSLSLQELEKSPYAKGALHGKLANVYPDLQDKALKTTGTFKMLTGGDMISTDRKYQGRLEFENHAKLIFSANKLPVAHDNTDAFFRRWVILSFPNVFEGKDRDPNLLDKLTTTEELSGLLNKSLLGLEMLQKRGDFSTTKSTDEWREEYVRMSDSIKAFVMDVIVTDPEAKIPKDELYRAFVEYCKNKKLPVKTNNLFSRELKAHVHFDDCTVLVDGKQKKAVTGVTINMEYITDISDIALFPYSNNAVGGKIKEVLGDYVED